MLEDRGTGSKDRVLKPGQRVYDEDGEPIGVIQGITDLGVAVNTLDDVDTLSLRQSPSVNVGEGYLVWRCSECGELGDIDRLPDCCPSCGAGKDTLYAYLED
jgi:hypothetical protein